MNPPGLLLAAGGFLARPRTRTILLRHVMAKQITLAKQPLMIPRCRAALRRCYSRTGTRISSPPFAGGRIELLVVARAAPFI
jgi:hypothetical protein